VDDVGLEDATLVGMELGVLVVINSVKLGALLGLIVNGDCVGTNDEVKLPFASGAQFLGLSPSSKQRQKGCS
jgi:hypothetical protein